MIIDFHSHIFPDSLAERAEDSLKGGAGDFFKAVHKMTEAGLIAHMDKAGIDKSVVLPVVTKRSQVKHLNEWVVSLNPDRIIPFGGIFPNAEDYKEQIDFVASLGLKGIKLHAEFQDFVADDPHMMHVYDYAFNKGLIVVHHAGADPAFKPPFRSDPRMFAHIVDTLKGGVMVAAHMGGLFQWDEVLSELAGHNIYFDTSTGAEYYSDEMFYNIVEKHGVDKILFATDSPWNDSVKEVEVMKSRTLSDMDKEKIFCGNAERILDL